MICPICNGEWYFNKAIKRPVCKKCSYIDIRGGSWEGYSNWDCLDRYKRRMFNSVCLIVLGKGICVDIKDRQIGKRSLLSRILDSISNI